MKIAMNKNKKNVYFTSDLHLGHVNIIKHCNRPFSSVEEMDNVIIERWNNTVTDKDVVYILGDFSFYKDQQKSVDVLNKLKGAEKHLILGNHDTHMKAWVKNVFTSCSSYKEIQIIDESFLGGKRTIVLFHYAMKTWNKMHHNSISLYGHSHGTIPGTPQSLDVGVDCWDFFPCSYTQIKEKLNNTRLG